jgi:hypothetical protein
LMFVLFWDELLPMHAVCHLNCNQKDDSLEKRDSHIFSLLCTCLFVLCELKDLAIYLYKARA